MDTFSINSVILKFDYYFLKDRPKNLSKSFNNLDNYGITPNSLLVLPISNLGSRHRRLFLNQYDVTHLIDFEKVEYPQYLNPIGNEKYCLIHIEGLPYSQVKFKIPEDIDIRDIKFLGYPKNIMGEDLLGDTIYLKGIDPSSIKIHNQYYKGSFDKNKKISIPDFRIVYFCKVDENKIIPLESWKYEGNKYILTND